MTRKSRSWLVRIAFEPNRFSAEQLKQVYEQLKPTDGRSMLAPALCTPAMTAPTSAKWGRQ
jgi:hypothetical protein